MLNLKEHETNLRLGLSGFNFQFSTRARRDIVGSAPDHNTSANLQPVTAHETWGVWIETNQFNVNTQLSDIKRNGWVKIKLRWEVFRPWPEDVMSGEKEKQFPT